MPARMNLHLIRTFAAREIDGRYRGSLFGYVWSLATPLLMLVVFTLFFSTIMQARWEAGTGSTTEFAIILFAGLIVFNMFSEVVGRAPTLVLSQANLVKKVVFPLEILPIAALIAALFQAAIAAVALIFVQMVWGSGFHLATLLVPVLILPLCLVTLGLGWLLSALGVYVRDISHFIGPVLTALMFLSPIFYPISRLPQNLRWLGDYSPLAFTIETVRNAMIFGNIPDIVTFLHFLAAGIASAGLGFSFFMKTRKGFADVL